MNTVADNLLCNNFLHFGYTKTEQNLMNVIEKQSTLTVLIF